MSEELILAIDAGTTSTRVLAFDLMGGLRAKAGRPLTQYFPQPGWVEHDAEEIFTRTLACLTDVFKDLGPAAAAVKALGITNQRETVVLWDKRTGVPLDRAIVWQDRRTDAICSALRDAGHEPLVQANTGLVLDPYFSATKIAHLLNGQTDVQHIAAGTIETWLVWKLTGGLHITDATNASRTSLMALQGGWDAGLCDLFNVPTEILPDIVDCAGSFGSTRADLTGHAIPIAGLIGDQQSATVGQACIIPGDVKATYGTGAFMLAATGATPIPSQHRLLTTVAHQINGVRGFALEGSIFVAGSAVQWLRDGLKMIDSSAETAALAESVENSGGVIFVPALTGLGAPYWRADARGLLTGLTRGTERAHIVRACLEAVSEQTADLLDAFAGNGCTPQRLRVDGGMSANTWLMQDLANALEIAVERPTSLETTALGAAVMAGIGVGLFKDLSAAQQMRHIERVFEPKLTQDQRATRRAVWSRAIQRALME
jgi:glycerol kinase